ncbi:MAG: hypothetical protein ACXQTL_05950 [Methanosarcinales archaeon]
MSACQHTGYQLRSSEDEPVSSTVLQLKAYVLDHQHWHTEPVRVRGILCAPEAYQSGYKYC